MNRVFLIIILLNLHLYSYSIEYDEILKLEAKGLYSEAIELYDRYFEENLNDINQDSIIEKLIHSSTLYRNIDETQNHLLHYVKYMKNPHSRFIIYRRIGEIYELSGNIYKAGIYYEKAAYVNEEYVDFDLFFDSIELLIELGYLNLSLEKINSIETNEDFDKNRYHIIKARIYELLGERESTLTHFYNIDRTYYKWSFYAMDLDVGPVAEVESLDSLIFLYPYLRARTPIDFISRKSLINKDSYIKTVNEKEVEIYIGRYQNESDYAGIINILEQLNIPWYLDREHGFASLYAFTFNYNETKKLLIKAGISLGD